MSDSDPAGTAVGATIAYKMLSVAASFGAFLVLLASLVRGVRATSGLVAFAFLASMLLVGAAELAFVIMSAGYLSRPRRGAELRRRFFRLLAIAGTAAFVGRVIEALLLVIMVRGSLRAVPAAIGTANGVVLALLFMGTFASYELSSRRMNTKHPRETEHD